MGPRKLFRLRFGAQEMHLGVETKIMGVLNVTPDSFSDGGSFSDPGAAEAHALRLQDEGAHFLDVGAESTRPGATPVSAKEEIRRLTPVLKRLAGKIKIPVSVDTAKGDVGLAALELGASLINDIRALQGNRRLAKAIARSGAGVVLMHMQGRPSTMQKKPAYRHLLKEVFDFLEERAEFALDAGIPRSSILVDPGFGFGKTVNQNMELLSRLDFFERLRLPVLVGLSRKSFIGHLLAAPVHERLYGSLAAASVAIFGGAHVLRVHDVLAHRQLSALVDASLSRREK